MTATKSKALVILAYAAALLFAALFGAGVYHEVTKEPPAAYRQAESQAETPEAAGEKAVIKIVGYDVGVSYYGQVILTVEYIVGLKQDQWFFNDGKVMARYLKSIANEYTIEWLTDRQPPELEEYINTLD